MPRFKILKNVFFVHYFPRLLTPAHTIPQNADKAALFGLICVKFPQIPFGLSLAIVER
jgi:hypothetical protein